MMKSLSHAILAVSVAGSTALTSLAARAQQDANLESANGLTPADGPGGALPWFYAKDWQLGFQPAGSPIMEVVESFHDYILIIISIITAFVLALLVWCIVRFNAKANPTPSRTSHNTVIEVAWTIVPVLILLIIAIPSFRLLYDKETTPADAEMTVKAVGYQWYWGYEYPDHGDFAFNSIMLQPDELQPGQPRLLAVDREMVVPAGKTIRLIVTGADVIHSFALPAFALKTDAIPGRLNEAWFRADQPGVYYGQCSEICGRDHAFMPTAIRVLPEAEWQAWLAARYEEFGVDPASLIEPAPVAALATAS